MFLSRNKSNYVGKKCFLFWNISYIRMGLICSSLIYLENLFCLNCATGAVIYCVIQKWPSWLKIMPVESTTEVLAHIKYLATTRRMLWGAANTTLPLAILWWCVPTVCCVGLGKRDWIKNGLMYHHFQWPTWKNLCFLSHNFGLCVFRNYGSQSKIDFIRGRSKISVDFKLCLVPRHWT